MTKRKNDNLVINNSKPDKIQKNSTLVQNTDKYAIHAEKATHYYDQYSSKQIIDIFNGPIKKKIKYIPDYKQRSIFYTQVGKLNEAIQDLNSILDLKSDDIFSLTSRGNLLRDKGQFDLAIQDFNAALQHEPNNPFALAGRGEVYLQQGKFELALQDFNAALLHDPNNTYILIKRAQVFSKLNQLDNALQDLNSALFKNPSNNLALAWRGDVYLKQRHLDLALQDLNAAVLNVFDNTYFLTIAFALANRGDVYRLQGKLDEALQDLNTILQKFPNHILVLVRRGDVYRQQGKLDEALRDLNKALQLQPKNRSILESRKSLYIEKKEFSNAIKDEYQLVRTTPYSNNNGFFPTLSSLAKLSILEHESLICSSGEVLRHHPDKLRELFLHHNINPASLSGIREIKNIPIAAYSIFQQLDSLDLKKVEEIASKYTP